MGFFKRIYKENIYGIIGTLIFHILLVSVLLLSEINVKSVISENDIVIEIPFVQEEEIEMEKTVDNRNDLTPNNPSDLTNQTCSTGRTNLPSNKLATNDKFFDENYRREIQSAQNLVKEVNRQLAKEPEDLGEIKMPVETTEGQDPEALKNKNYTGDSNISYYLENRYHLRLPVPVYLAKGGGKVIVDITVNRDGKVTEALPRKTTGVRDPLIYEYARVAALRTVFNAEPSAPAQQTGTIHYTFIPQ